MIYDRQRDNEEGLDVRIDIYAHQCEGTSIINEGHTRIGV